MNKKLSTFLFFSYFICSGINSFASDRNTRSRRSNRYEVKQGEICLCNKTFGFTGGQVFTGLKVIANWKDAEIYSARFVDPMINSFYFASKRNRKLLQTLSEENNYYRNCFENNPNIVTHFGGDVGLRYMWGGFINGMACSLSCGFEQILNLRLKPNAETIMINDLQGEGVTETEISKIKTVFDEKFEEKSRKNNNGKINYSLPETLKVSIASLDLLLEKYHCFIGDLCNIEGVNRKNFCLVGSLGLGGKFNFAEVISDIRYKTLPTFYKEFAKEHLFSFVPVTKFGIQTIFKSGFFMELNLFIQMLNLSFLIPLPVPLAWPTLGSIDEIIEDAKEDFSMNGSKNPEGLKVLAALNPELSLRFGYDLYGLLKGEKLEEFYDN